MKALIKKERKYTTGMSFDDMVEFKNGFQKALTKAIRDWEYEEVSLAMHRKMVAQYEASIEKHKQIKDQMVATKAEVDYFIPVLSKQDAEEKLRKAKLEQIAKLKAQVLELELSVNGN